MLRDGELCQHKSGAVDYICHIFMFNGRAESLLAERCKNGNEQQSGAEKPCFEQ
jgi:hypothetical protein